MALLMPFTEVTPPLGFSLVFPSSYIQNSCFPCSYSNAQGAGSQLFIHHDPCILSRVTAFQDLLPHSVNVTLHLALGKCLLIRKHTPQQHSTPAL